MENEPLEAAYEKKNGFRKWVPGAQTQAGTRYDTIKTFQVNKQLLTFLNPLAKKNKWKLNLKVINHNLQPTRLFRIMKRIPCEIRNNQRTPLNSTSANTKMGEPVTQGRGSDEVRGVETEGWDAARPALRGARPLTLEGGIDSQ